MVKKSTAFLVLRPDLQVSFHYKLQALRDLYLHDALKNALRAANIDDVNRELSASVSAGALAKVASFGLRGEIFFPVPCLIRAKPSLIGYYRLLFGLSQKAFYSKGPFGRFKRLEEADECPPALAKEVPALCKSLVATGELLVKAVSNLSLEVVHDLQLLTLGPQLRGGENTRLGRDATTEAFDLIKSIVSSYIKDATERVIIIENESGRKVMVEFAHDPDVSITEVLTSATRPLVSIEIKGGTDASNIHNRLGEAEKSHQKAKGRGFFEFWTIIRCDINADVARRESPTTSHLFHLDRIKQKRSAESKEFRELLASIMGIRISK